MGATSLDLGGLGGLFRYDVDLECRYDQSWTGIAASYYDGLDIVAGISQL